MCGIVAAIGTCSTKLEYRIRGFLSEAAHVGVVRGDDSLGILQLEKKAGVTYDKLPISGRYACENKIVTRRISDFEDSTATILHHRAATRGSVTWDNCHPFEHYDDERSVTGVHNGTLRKWKSKDDGYEFSVDSDWLYYKIWKDGAKKALEEIDGAYALVWIEQPEKFVYISSNHERPIYWAKVRGENMLLVASEAAMLYWLSTRHEVEIEDIQSTDETLIYRINPENVEDLTSIKLEKAPLKVLGYGWSKPETAGSYNPGKSKGARKMSATLGEYGCKELGMELGTEIVFYPEADSLEQEGKPDGLYGFCIPAASIGSKDEGEVYSGMIFPMAPGAIVTVREAVSVRCRLAGVCSMRPPGSMIEQPALLLTHPHAFDMIGEDSEEEDKPYVPGPRGLLISQKKFNSITKRGCCNCGLDVKEEDAFAGDISWVNNDTDPMCKTCVDDWNELYKTRSLETI